MAIDIGVLTSDPVGDSGSYVPINGITCFFITASNPANADGTLSAVYARIQNTSDVACTMKWGIYAYTYLGDNQCQLTRRSLSSSVSVEAGFNGVKSLTGQSISVHAGDVIGIEVTFTATASNGDFWCMCSSSATDGNIGGGATSGFTNGVYYVATSDPAMISGTGSDYPVGTGIGGTPKDMCHDVDETVGRNVSSTKLWGVVTPRDFGVSGGVSSAYVDLTFPWDTAGTFTEDVVFQHDVKREWTNPTNPLEHYSLKMGVFRFNDNVPDVDILNPSFEEYLDNAHQDHAKHWTAANAAVNGSAVRSGGGGVTDGSAAFYLTLYGDCESQDYVSVEQDCNFNYGVATIEFDINVAGNIVNGSSFELLVDGVSYYERIITNETWTQIYRVAVEVLPGAGVYTIKFKHTKTSSSTAGGQYVIIDNLRVVTRHAIASGRVYAFTECWWLDTANGDVWVDADAGSDYNLGTETQPFKTLDKGYTEVAVGGTVHVKCTDTSYPSQYGMPSKSCIIKPGTTIVYSNSVNSSDYFSTTTGFLQVDGNYCQLLIMPSQTVNKTGTLTQWRICSNNPIYWGSYMLIIFRRNGTRWDVVGASGPIRPALGDSITPLQSGTTYKSVWIPCSISVQSGDVIGVCNYCTSEAGFGGVSYSALSGAANVVYRQADASVEDVGASAVSAGYVNDSALASFGTGYWFGVQTTVSDAVGKNKIYIASGTTAPSEPTPDPIDEPDEPTEPTSDAYFSIGLSGSGADYICGESSAQTQINQAIVAAQATENKRHVRFITAGTYWISDSIGGSAVTINNLEISAVPGVTIKLQAGLSWAEYQSMIHIETTGTKTNIRIHGFTLDGNYDNYSSVSNGTDYYTCIFVTYFDGLYVYDMNLVDNKNDGLRASHGSHLYYYNCYTHGGHDGLNGYDIDNVRVYHNEFYCRTNCGARVYTGDDVQIYNNKIYATGSCGSGIQLQAGVTNAKIYQNTIHDMYWSGIWLTQHGASTTTSTAAVEVYDNLIYNCGSVANAYVGGISINGFQATIHHNKLDRNYGYGIRVCEGYYAPINTGWVEDTDFNIISNTRSPYYAGYNHLTASHTLRIENSWLYNNSGGTVNCTTGGNSTADPQYTDSANANYTLPSSSPAYITFQNHVVGCDW